ncbi:unnamed protein product [Pararhodospirillum photometricum DSM 122]|uniref:Uncharacterized protein n=1 Tax=Pararhodospirillum photometricum DSM 122 TaxID=1150469 RepID=H6SRI6_PARPM|nr:unnamed protein product [Pararhodospirillum photometricum DSM 122]
MGLVGFGGDHDVGAIAGGAQGDRLADTPTGAGNKQGLVFQRGHDASRSKGRGAVSAVGHAWAQGGNGGVGPVKAVRATTSAGGITPPRPTKAPRTMA